MPADFLPPAAAEIKDKSAIELLQQLQRRELPLPSGDEISVPTAYIHRAGDPSGTPILLLPGFDSSVLEFRALLPRVTCDTWAVDWYGCGFTEYMPHLTVNPHSIRQHLLGVIQTWIGEPVTLVGASLGGAIAIDLALMYPTWVRSLILINSVGFSGSFTLGPLLPSPLLEMGADWLFLRKRIALTAAMVLPIDGKLIDTLRCSRLHQDMSGWKDAIASLSQSGGYGDLSHRISRVQQPTLILWGENDDLLGPADAVRFEQAIPNSQLIWIPHAGHAPHCDQPDAIAQHLLPFIRSS